MSVIEKKNKENRRTRKKRKKVQDKEELCDDSDDIIRVRLLGKGDRISSSLPPSCICF